VSELVHGTANAYKNRGCRCPACTAAAVAYQRAYKRRVRLEGPLTEPAGETREHLERLLASGVSLAQVSRLTGLTSSNLRAIANGRTKRPLRVPGGKARRLIEAMGEAGIPQTQIARALRYEHPTNLKLSRREYVTRRSWDRLVTLYRHFARRGLVAADILEEVGE